MKVKLSAWASKYYPVMARFRLNGNDYSLVFESRDEAKRYFDGRFYPKKIEFVEV